MEQRNESRKLMGPNVASKIIGSLLRIDQISACDGEQIQLKCAAEHNIEILAVEKTILSPRQQLSSPSSSSLASAATSSLGNQRPDQLNDQLTTDAICRPQQQHQNQTGNERTPSNGTTYCNLDEKSNQVSNEVLAKLRKLVESECHLKNSCSLDLTWPPQISSSSSSSSPPPASNSDKNNTIELEHKLSALPNNNTIHTMAAKNSTELQQHLISNSFNTTTPMLNQFKIAQLLYESDNCPANRKLLELVYRCRPQRLRTRFACGSTVANLECSESKSLIVSGAHFGYHPADKKIHDKCRLSQNNIQSVLPTTPCGPISNRSASALMISECSFRRQCRLDVTPQTFGDTNCTLPSGQSEYLAFMYVCVDDTLINRNSSAYLHWNQQRQHKNNSLLPQQQQQQQQQQQFPSGSAAPFISSNVSSSSLLSSPPPMSNSFISPPSGPGGLLNNPLSSSSQTSLNMSNDVDNDADDNQPPFTISTRVLTVVGGDPQLSSTNPFNWTPGQRAKFVWLRYQPLVILVTVVSITMILLAFTVRVCRHQARSRSSKNSSKSSSTSSNKSSTSSDHSGTSCSSSLPIKSLSSNASTLAVGQHQHHHQHHQMSIRGGIISDQAGNANDCLGLPNNSSQALKHNSCSDSCFSLDDYNCFNHQATSATNNHNNLNNNNTSSQADSPGLQTTNNSTPMLDSVAPSDQQQQQQQPYSAGYMSSARPKFWSFYGNEQNSGSLRLGSAYGHLGNVASQQQHQHQSQFHAGTMRPTRTFMGQQQQQHPPFVNRLVNTSSSSSSSQQQNEQYLLTMANVMQRNQMGDWRPSPSLPHQQQPQLQPTDGHFNHNQHLHHHHHHVHQLDQQDQQAMDALLASLNVVGLDQQHQPLLLQPPAHQLANQQAIDHQQMGASQQQQQQHQVTCSFHTQQQQQSQQTFSQPQQEPVFAGPQATGGGGGGPFHLELPSATGVASVHVAGGGGTAAPAAVAAAAAAALTPTSQTAAGAPAAVIIGGQQQQQQQQ